MCTPTHTDPQTHTPPPQSSIDKGLMVSCEHATALSSRKEDRGLSWYQNLQLRFHLLFCKYCRRFVRQNKHLSQVLEQHGTSPEQPTSTAFAPLDEAQKAAMEAVLQEKLNNS